MVGTHLHPESSKRYDNIVHLFSFELKEARDNVVANILELSNGVLMATKQSLSKWQVQVQYKYGNGCLIALLRLS